MKECNRCHIVKDDNEFAFRNKTKGTLQPYCKECKREIDKCIIICANCHRDFHFKESEEYDNWNDKKRT